MKLVLGAQGFIGQNIQGDLKLDHKSLDLLDKRNVFEVFKKYMPTSIINCAGIHTSFVSSTENSQMKQLFQNLRIDMNILECAAELAVSNVLLLSSTTALGSNNLEKILSEEDLSGKPDDRFFGYAYAKRTQIQLCDAVRRDNGYNYKSAMLGNIYGPGNHFAKNSTAISSLIYQICGAMQSREPKIRFFGDGLARRNWTYVKDLNFIFNKLLNHEENQEPLIVSSMEIQSIRNIAKIVSQSCGYDGELIFEENSSPTSDKIVSNSKLLSIIGKFEFTNIQEGIDETVKWYLSQNRFI